MIPEILIVLEIVTTSLAVIFGQTMVTDDVLSGI